jgi:hypothetical protein
MNTHTFTVQQIDDILFDLYCEKNSLIKYLKELDEDKLNKEYYEKMRNSNDDRRNDKYDKYDKV